MARGVNKAIIVGTLGRDPEVRYTANGTAIATLSVATNESWKDRDGNQQERTEWHRILLWGRLGEVAGEYLKKGSMAYFEGRIQTSKWQDQSGADRYTTEIVASEMQMLGGKGQGDQSHEARRPPRRDAGGQSQPAAPPPPDDDLYDDIPF